METINALARTIGYTATELRANEVMLYDKRGCEIARGNYRNIEMFLRGVTYTILAYMGHPVFTQLP